MIWLSKHQIASKRLMFIDKEKTTLTEKNVPEEMKKEALAHALLGSYLYKNRLYKAVKRNKVRSVLD
mgnify:CR=1 FL=1